MFIRVVLVLAVFGGLGVAVGGTSARDPNLALTLIAAGVGVLVIVVALGFLAVLDQGEDKVKRMIDLHNLIVDVHKRLGVAVRETRELRDANVQDRFPPSV